MTMRLFDPTFTKVLVDARIEQLRGHRRPRHWAAGVVARPNARP
jgi:hypothetical protein